MQQTMHDVIDLMQIPKRALLPRPFCQALPEPCKLSRNDTASKYHDRAHKRGTFGVLVVSRRML